jgi:hypothetical protein
MITLPIKNFKIDTNTDFNIADLHCKELAFDKPYEIMKYSFDLIRSILTGSFGYHGRLKTFIKPASYGQIVFQKKD